MATIQRIYCLRDVKGNPFYVGRTSDSLKHRLQNHIDHAKRGWGNHMKSKIIIESNFKISIELLQQIYGNTKKGQDLETAWIHRFNSMGVILTNLCQTYY